MNLLRAALVVFFAATSFVPALALSAAESRGATVYAGSGCQHCHTVHDDGGGDRGPDLSEVGRRRSKTQIRTQILHGGQQMPPFADVLKKSEVDDLVAYLHSCRDQKTK
jgi:mono/diheme cytochrome c family protein